MSGLLLPDNAVRQLMTVIGTPPVALLISLGGQLDAGHPSADEPEKLGEVTGSAILVGGRDPRRRRRRRLWRCLVASGIGNALAEALETIHLPLMPAAFLLSLVLQASQDFGHRGDPHHLGLLSQAVVGLEPLQLVLVTLATCFGGSLGLSRQRRRVLGRHALSPGLSVPDGLKTWTVLTTIMGVVGFLITWLL